MRLRALATMCLAALSAAALSACGAIPHRPANAAASAPTNVVDIYSSLPLHGPSAAAAIGVLSGIKLALAQARSRAGRFTVHYASLDDSAGSHGWDATHTAADARRAAADPRAVYYIGELDDEASEVSMPILNEAGVPQVSPTNTYVGLTTSEPGSMADEPRRYSPTGTRTYLRIVPTDSVQAKADLEAMAGAGCTRVALAGYEAYGAGMLRLIDRQKHRGVSVVSQTSVDPSAASLRSYAAAIEAERVDCFLLAGTPSADAVRIATAVHAALPNARIFAPGPMCTPAWTSARRGGVPAGVARLIRCTAVTRSVASYPGGSRFAAAYKAMYGVSNPSPYAILGYEAMQLGLSTIAGLGADGNRKSAVLGALFATTDRHSVLGTYGFDRDGDTTLNSIGLYNVGSNGDPRFSRTITVTQPKSLPRPPAAK